MAGRQGEVDVRAGVEEGAGYLDFAGAASDAERREAPVFDGIGDCEG